MSERINFLPWLRGGLGRVLTLRDTGQTSAARGTGFLAEIDVVDAAEPVTRQITLKGPDQAGAIDLTQIARRYPAPGTPDAEYGYFPHIEFVAPGLPWVLSPFGPDEDEDLTRSTGRLRPWLVLVCVEDATATLFTRFAAPAQQLTCDADALPDLSESWGWAHVQAPADADVAAAVNAGTGEVIARLVAPRRLEPNRAYTCALVNAWRRNGEALEPAWQAGQGPVTLDVFDSWRFTTGQVGSFEELCERLGPLPEGSLTLGVNQMDVSVLGLFSVDGMKEGKTVDYTGALLDEDVPIQGLAGAVQADYADKITDIVNAGTARREIDPKAPDPVVAPPFYGTWATGREEIPSGGWMHQLNLPLRRRAAAGLGAQIVREQQERFMALAWDQAGQVREVNRELSRIRAQAENGRSWKAKAQQLTSLGVLSVLRAQSTFARTELGQPLRLALAGSSLPDGLLSPAFARVTRPSGVVAKTLRAGADIQQEPGEERPPGHRLNWQTEIGTLMDDVDARDDLAIGTPRAPVGMQTSDFRRDLSQGATSPEPGKIPDIGEPVSLKLTVTAKDAAQATLDLIRPIRTAKMRMLGRAPALADKIGGDPDSTLPPHITTGPEINEALVWLLMEKSRELLCPGISDFPNNAVRLLEADGGFTAAFLAGANHEFTRELLWREYPADLGFTSFRRFWERPDPVDVDIDPMDTWKIQTSLATQGKAGGETAILLIRGDLIRQYPNVRIYLKEPDVGAVPGQVHFPSFTGTIPPDIRFLGFDVEDTEPITDPISDDAEWKVIIEEQPTEPRFGLDLIGTEPLTTYSELAWTHLEQSEVPWLAIAPETGFASNPDLAAEATWGLNGAHMAFATWQQPYRRVFRATDLLREPTS